ncbi:hypothetical protein INT44_005713 [Umbelopsis vinacea]|uniref:CCHC-type domain-containing protein n=1 Tax=Umbelopsis vinacea TaxID=44442 RepID=A0A8H7PYS7_9FUNG|nr:hypothetical protein INT44_005713 [Umbelopsis vinacea]
MKSLPMPRYSRKENPEHWLKMFKATAKVQEWISDEDKLMVIPIFFKSEVRAWFFNGEFTEFEVFSSAFIERFGPKMNKYTPLKKLLSIKKKPNELAGQYSDRFRWWKVMHDESAKKDPKAAALSEDDLLHQFIVGLNPKPLRQAVRSENPKNLEAAMRKAIEMEEDENDSFSDSDEGSAERRQESSDSSASEDEEKPSKSHETRMKESSTRDDAVENLTKQIAEVRIYMMSQVPSKMKCFNCQDPGHEAAQCPSSCKLCKGQDGVKGHAFFDCPRYTPRGQQRKSCLSDGSINPNEEWDHAMAVKRGHETASLDPGVALEKKKIKVADLLHNSQMAKQLAPKAPVAVDRQDTIVPPVIQDKGKSPEIPIVQGSITSEQAGKHQKRRHHRYSDGFEDTTEVLPTLKQILRKVKRKTAPGQTYRQFGMLTGSRRSKRLFIPVIKLVIRKGPSESRFTGYGLTREDAPCWAQLVVDIHRYEQLCNNFKSMMSCVESLRDEFRAENRDKLMLLKKAKGHSLCISDKRWFEAVSDCASCLRVFLDFRPIMRAERLLDMVVASIGNTQSIRKGPGRNVIQQRLEEQEPYTCWAAAVLAMLSYLKLHSGVVNQGAFVTRRVNRLLSRVNAIKSLRGRYQGVTDETLWDRNAYTVDGSWDEDLKGLGFKPKPEYDISLETKVAYGDSYDIVDGKLCAQSTLQEVVLLLSNFGQVAVTLRGNTLVYHAGGRKLYITNVEGVLIGHYCSSTATNHKVQILGNPSELASQSEAIVDWAKQAIRQKRVDNLLLAGVVNRGDTYGYRNLDESLTVEGMQHYIKKLRKQGSSGGLEKV